MQGSFGSAWHLKNKNRINKVQPHKQIMKMLKKKIKVVIFSDAKSIR